MYTFYSANSPNINPTKHPHYTVLIKHLDGKKKLSPEKFYPRTKIFSNCAENFCLPRKILSA